MAIELLEDPPDDGHLWIPKDALPGVKILYTPGRNTKDADGRFSYLRRQKRQIITMEISHTMSGSGTETVRSFASGETPDKATLSEIDTLIVGNFFLLMSIDLVGFGL
jgi:hypothetical protein